MSEVYGYDVLRDERRYQTSEGDEDGGQYSNRGSTYTEHSLNGLVRVTEFPDLTYSKLLNPGDEAYLVYVIYNSGDSFGHDEARYFEPVALYDSAEKAQAAVEAIHEHARNNDPNGPYEVRFNLKLLDNEGNEFSTYTSWLGYFNGIYRCDYESLEVCPSRKR